MDPKITVQSGNSVWHQADAEHADTRSSATEPNEAAEPHANHSDTFDSGGKPPSLPTVPRSDLSF